MRVTQIVLIPKQVSFYLNNCLTSISDSDVQDSLDSLLFMIIGIIFAAILLVFVFVGCIVCFIIIKFFVKKTKNDDDLIELQETCEIQQEKNE